MTASVRQQIHDWLQNHREEMMEYIKGPDFPTGGIVVNKDELVSVYET